MGISTAYLLHKCKSLIKNYSENNTSMKCRVLYFYATNT